MALEVKVFKEIKEYRAKVLFGMSWRQFFTTIVTIPLIAGAYSLAFVTAGENTGILAVMLVSIPGFAFGW
ncbi:PrgI family protein, partial [Arcanobacterium bovis]|uniref:PrgI family protein n=1 Tax=Arcanobacterium bovis TaxID=2529275 RepID=UPI0036156D03